MINMIMGTGSGKKGGIGSTDYDGATEPYLMELRKIFVRKLLATCTSFSEGIFWATISTIFIFLGSRGRNTHTKSSSTFDWTHSRRQEKDHLTFRPMVLIVEKFVHTIALQKTLCCDSRDSNMQSTEITCLMILSVIAPSPGQTNAWSWCHSFECHGSWERMRTTLYDGPTMTQSKTTDTVLFISH